ncbi:hypothetical protein [Stieleria mannarensis]|uniref:hypothetical protein n=1 Tax=Stieleria mannarensis TaxID=2755585 RepID=UPI0015FF6F33|nr:hypothetical protein [Rhodopirellula sp. JC639]
MTSLRELSHIILTIPPGRRGAVVQLVVGDRAEQLQDTTIDLDSLRSAFVQAWQSRFAQPHPAQQLHDALLPPVPFAILLEFNKLDLPETEHETKKAVEELLDFLKVQDNQSDSCSDDARSGDAPSSLQPSNSLLCMSTERGPRTSRLMTVEEIRTDFECRHDTRNFYFRYLVNAPLSQSPFNRFDRILLRSGFYVRDICEPILCNLGAFRKRMVRQAKRIAASVKRGLG